MILMDPLLAIIISFAMLGLMLFKRVNLGITLNVTALILAFLTLRWANIPEVIYATSANLMTISVVLATFAIMWLSELYKETGLIYRLSTSLGEIIRNPKIVLSALPPVIGLLPVAGGALMSAPLVDSEGEKLGLSLERKAYVNMWFRHTIFPIYPIGQSLILTAALAGTTILTIILRQVPVVLVMIIVGYVIGFWKTKTSRDDKRHSRDQRASFKIFLATFLPILVTIIVAVALEFANFGFGRPGLNVLIATLVGIIMLLAISKPTPLVLFKPLKSWDIYGITAAAYGAFLLGNVMQALGVSEIFQTFASTGNVDITVLLVFVPAVLGILTASPLGGISISVPILSSLTTLSPEIASLIYMSAYLGYVVSPTHLCFAFTARYFNCPLSKAYKYLTPSLLMTFASVLLVYFLL